MTTASQTANARAVDEWNEENPPGTPVRTGPGRLSKTRSWASVLGGHTPVVWVEGRSGCIALTHVEPVEAEVREWLAQGATPDQVTYELERGDEPYFLTEPDVADEQKELQ